MRKFFRVSALTALAVGAMAITAQAQEKTVGLVAGVNFSTLTGDHVSDAGSRTGFIGGLFVGIPVGSNFVIEPGALYSMKGGSDSYVDFGSPETDNYDLDYIEIPILVRYNTRPDGGFYIFAGPSVSINVGCNLQVDYDGVDVFDDKCSAVKDATDGDWDISAQTVISGTAGVGFSNGRVGIEGRYGWDWGNAVESMYLGEQGGDIKNQVWSILVRVTK